MDRALKKQCHHLNRQAKRLLVEAVIVLFALVPLVGVAEESLAENPLPKILRDWAKRRQDVGLVQYRFSGTRTWPRGAFTEKIFPPHLRPGYVQEAPPFSKPSAEDYLPVTKAPPEDNPLQDVTGVIKSTVTLDFNNNRCRVESENDLFNNLSRLLEHYRANYVGNEGVNSAHILQGVPNPPLAPLEDFLVQQGDHSLIPASCFQEVYYYPLFFASGVVPTGDQRVKVTDIAPEVDSQAFKFEGYSTVDGRRCAHFRVDYEKRYSQTTDYWIDLGQDSAIVKYTSQLGSGKGNLVILQIDYAASGSMWLPKRWTTTSTAYSGKASIVESIIVSDVARLTNVSSETFVLKPSPGMYVKEYDYKREAKTKAFAVPAWTVRKSHYWVKADGGKRNETTQLDSFPGYNP